MLAPDLDRLPAVWVSPGLLLVPRAPSGATAWMLHAAAERGWVDLTRAMHESSIALRRAGAELLVTYFARELAQSLQAAALPAFAVEGRS